MNKTYRQDRLANLPPEIRVKIERQQKITNIKQRLSATDYQAIKFAEGSMTEAEFAPIREQRQAWRDEISKLE